MFGDTVVVGAHSFLWAMSRSCTVEQVFESDGELGEFGRADKTKTGHERARKLALGMRLAGTLGF